MIERKVIDLDVDGSSRRVVLNGITYSVRVELHESDSATLIIQEIADGK